MSMAFCSQALHQRFISGPSGSNWEKSYLSGLVWGSGSRSSGWLVILPPGIPLGQVVFPLRIAPHFMSCSGRSPASPQGQHVVVAAHLPVLFQDILDGILGRIVAGHPQLGESSVGRVFPRSPRSLESRSSRTVPSTTAAACVWVQVMKVIWPSCSPVTSPGRVGLSLMSRCLYMTLSGSPFGLRSSCMPIFRTCAGIGAGPLPRRRTW